MFKKFLLIFASILLISSCEQASEPQTEEDWLLFNTMQAEYDEASSQVFEAKSRINEHEYSIEENNLLIVAYEVKLMDESHTESEKLEITTQKHNLIVENARIRVVIATSQSVIDSNEILMKNLVTQAEFHNWTLEPTE